MLNTDHEDRGTREAAEQRAAPARKREPAHHGRDDRIEFEAASHPVVDDAHVARQRKPGEAREQRTDHVADDAHRVRAHAHEPRRFRIAADHVDAPSGTSRDEAARRTRAQHASQHQHADR